MKLPLTPLGIVLTLGFCTLPASAQDGQAPTRYHEEYGQKLTITFKDAASAARAKLSAMPLPDGKKWAVSCRWDDNTNIDLQMRETMEKAGVSGTFYVLNPSSGVGGWSHNTPRRLLKGGNSLGGHGWSHPMIGSLSRNRMFEEVLRTRIHYEADTNSPVCSYAFSFIDYANSLERTASARDVGRMLLRAGYWEVANRRRGLPADLPLAYAWLIGGEGATGLDKTRESLARILKNEKVSGADPCISYSMHAWSIRDKFDKMPPFFALLAGRDDAWQCNHGQYGAYRYQFTQSRITALAEGSKLNVSVVRPSLSDLNHTEPLSIAVTGVAAGDVVSVKMGDATLKLSTTPGALWFNLPHGDKQIPPQKIGWVANEQNRAELAETDADKDFPDLIALAWKRGGKLHLRIKNNTEQPLERIRLAYRLPLVCKQVKGYAQIGKLAPGAELLREVALEAATDDYLYTAGKVFYAVQADFMLGGVGARLYLTTCEPGTDKGPGYPSLGFAKLGPVPADQFDPAQAEAVAAGKQDGVTLADGTRLTFARNVDPGQTVFEKSVKRKDTSYALTDLHPEMIATTGLWTMRNADERVGVYLLRSRVHSEVEQPINILTTRYRAKTNKPDDYMMMAVYLNGKLVLQGGVKPQLDRDAILKAGANDVLIVARPIGFYHPENAGVYLRLCKPGTKTRLTNIRYECPVE
jgi:peptidoglycan/xylan/chitin deacetylase (PgdA/CDA1 family)